MEKNNNKEVVALLIVIIAILVALCILFATGTISFNTNTTKDNENNKNDITNNDMNNEENLTKDEAIEIVKKIYKGKFGQYIFNSSQLTYCDNNGESVSNEELGLEIGNGFYKCSEFKTYKELVNDIKKYVTEDYFNNVLLKKGFIKQSETLSDGKIYYNYYEKDGNLYAAITGKGGDLRKDKFLDDKTLYDITSYDTDKINAKINAYWLSVDKEESIEEISISIVNDNNSWKINSTNVKHE